MTKENQFNIYNIFSMLPRIEMIAPLRGNIPVFTNSNNLSKKARKSQRNKRRTTSTMRAYNRKK